MELDEESVVGDEDRSLSDPIDYATYDANTPSLFSMDENAVGDAEDVEIENRPYELVDKPEAEKKRRRQYSIKERLYLINEIEELHKSTSLRKECKQFSITYSMYRRWKKNESKYCELKNGKAAHLHKGRTGLLVPVAEELLSYIFELREQGMSVSNRSVVFKARELSPEFSAKSSGAQVTIVVRWLRKWGLVYPLGTHEAQRSPSETAREAKDFMEINKEKVSHRNVDKRYVINMDQTPIFLHVNPRKRLISKGRRQ